MPQLTVRAALIAAALAGIAAMSDAHGKAPDRAPRAARQCVTDMECERRHGPGNWFPHRKPAADALDRARATAAEADARLRQLAPVLAADLPARRR